MKKKRSAWTRQQIEDFRQWHSDLLVERGYDAKVVEELSRAREKFVLGIPVKDA